MSHTTLAWSNDAGIVTLTLNRPERLNAFTVEMADELVAAFRRASSDDAVRAVIVTGAGRAFCAGMDLGVAGNVFGLNETLMPTLSDIRERIDAPEIERGVRDTGGRVTLAIFECTKPVLAAVNGVAVGIGATMTLAMDVRLVSTQARYGFVFAKIGITPEACSTWFLPRIVGLSRALEWSYTGELIEPQEARQAGLVRSIHEPADLLVDAHRLAHAMTHQRSPVGVAMTRQMIYRNSAAAHPIEAHRIESLVVHYLSKRDGKEGVRAFLEKRTPEFTAKCSADMPPFYPWWE